MIKRLWAKNFGPYEKTAVDLTKMIAIFGPNGSGKSMLFTALKAIGRIARYPMRQQGDSMGGFPTRLGQVAFDDLVHRRDQSRTVTLGVEFETPELSGSYEVQLVSSDAPAGRIVGEILKVRAGSREVSIQADEEQANSTVGDAATFRLPRVLSIPMLLFKSHVAEDRALGASLQDLLWSRVGVFRFDPTMLKLPSEVGESLAPNGRNLASHLDAIRNGPDGRQDFDDMLSRFRAVCPHVRDIVLPIERTPDGPRQRIALLMEQSSQQIPAALESDGTLLLLAYTSLLFGQRSRDVLCIEEPENGLHPRVIKHLVTILRSLSSTAQVLVCSHSHQIFDELRAEEHLRLVRRASDGRSMVEHVTNSQLPSFAAWAGLTT